jgi:hypothetical protein
MILPIKMERKYFSPQLHRKTETLYIWINKVYRANNPGQYVFLYV